MKHPISPRLPLDIELQLRRLSVATVKRDKVDTLSLADISGQPQARTRRGGHPVWPRIGQVCLEGQPVVQRGHNAGGLREAGLIYGASDERNGENRPASPQYYLIGELISEAKARLNIFLIGNPKTTIRGIGKKESAVHAKGRGREGGVRIGGVGGLGGGGDWAGVGRIEPTRIAVIALAGRAFVLIAQAKI